MNALFPVGCHGNRGRDIYWTSPSELRQFGQCTGKLVLLRRRPCSQFVPRVLPQRNNLHTRYTRTRLRDMGPALVQCWASVTDAGSTLNQRWANATRSGPCHQPELPCIYFITMVKVEAFSWLFLVRIVLFLSCRSELKTFSLRWLKTGYFLFIPANTRHRYIVGIIIVGIHRLRT